MTPGRARAPLAAGLAVLLAIGAAGCVLPFRDAPLAADRRALAAAEAAAAEDPALGRARLEAFLAERPRSPLSDDAALALGRLERAAGRDDAAERAFRTGLARDPRGDRSDAIRLELASLLRDAGAVDAAWEVGRAMRFPLLAEGDRRRAARLLAELARARGDHVAELEWLARLRESSAGQEAVLVDVDVERAIAALPTATLLAAADRIGGPTGGRVWLEVAERAWSEGDRATVVRALGRATRAPLDPDDRERVERLDAALAGRPAPRAGASLPPPLGAIAADAPWPLPRAEGAIGVLLPMTGPYAGIARDTLAGVLLAARLFGPDAAAGLRVVVRDTGGSAAGAAAAVRELAADPEVVAAIGPLLQAELDAAAGAAEATGLPLLVPTRHESVLRPGAPIFRTGITRRLEAEALAEHAIGALGLRRFAILHPEDDYGREFERLLWEALEARGGRVVAVAGYPAGARELTDPIRALLGWNLLDEAERARLAERGAASAGAAGAAREAGAAPLWGGRFSAEAADAGDEALPPTVDFEALFLPDVADTVLLAAPQLAREGVESVRLFGSSAWHHPALLRAGPVLEGAFFTSGFDPEHPSSLVRGFVARYREAYGETPTVFAAQGFDAANLVALGLERGARTREALAAGLRKVRLHPGVSGTLSFDGDGSARRRPFLVGVRAGRMVSLE